jgi:phosphoribosylcarboxyaminoimidazole (NCAIR) mutase
MATLPGVPLYRSFGFTDVETTTVTMPDGVSIATVAMQRTIRPAS